MREIERIPLATPNYSYEKRQRELAKKRKKEEKLQRKSQRQESPGGEQAETPEADSGAPQGDAAQQKD